MKKLSSKLAVVPSTALLDANPVSYLLASLDEREAIIITMRFGLEDGYTRTWEETAKQFRVTRERARQIGLRALRKMRDQREAVEELRMLVVSNPTLHPPGWSAAEPR